MADADTYKIKIKDLALFVRNVQSSLKITVHATNHQSFRQLSQKHVVLDVIHVATGNRIYFDFYTSDGVFTAGHFLETLLSYGPAAKESQLTGVM
jgi:hypothetical protein